MKHYLPKNTEDGAALIITLLIVVLLATISVSFFSTTRTEQTATRNYTSKTQAEQFATLATQEAMAKIQQGFTANATGTTVITTQPGQITKYFFLNGNCTGNASTLLYSQNGTKVADLNNLQNPGYTTQVRGNTSANQTFTITGNSSDRLLVNMENVISNGTTVGRIAYYVDDELTKININASTDNRTTLNVSTPRHMSLSALTTANLTTFRKVIEGTLSNNETNVNNFGYVFRKEQAEMVTGFNGNQMSNISTAPLSDFHLKYTPWGARRLHINDEPLNSTGVDNVYAALSSQHLTNIYGQNFNNKYGQQWSWTGNMSQTSNTTVNGLKQTIANMLQMRTPGSYDIPTVAAGFTGAVISESGTSAFPPTSYYAHIPSACINEFAVKIDYMDWDVPGGARGILLFIKPFIEFSRPYQNPYGSGNYDVHLQATIQSLTYTIRDSAGNTANRTVGPFTISYSYKLTGATRFITNGSNGAAIPFYTSLSQQVNTSYWHIPGFPQSYAATNMPWTIIGNPTMVMGDVKLFAGTLPSPAALRDWIPGSLINRMLPHITINGTNSLVLNTPFKNSTSDNYDAIQNFNSSNTSLQRIDPRIKGETAWVQAPHTFCRNITTGLIYNNGNAHPDSSNALYGFNTFLEGYGLRPSETSSRDIPGDSSPMGTNEPEYFIATEHNWIYFSQKLHSVDASGNATFNTPHDLGKVPTNVNWRRLRFMPRHTRENARNLIPDWAMLDVISFSSNNSSMSPVKIAPINLNGRFACDTLINANPPSPRNNIAALAKGLENSTPANFQIGSSLLQSLSGANQTFPKADMVNDINVKGIISDCYNYFRGNSTNLASTLANNIANRSWSTQNGTWSAWRNARGWPSSTLALPAEITEISGIADYGARSQYVYDNTGTTLARSIKENEGRLSAFFPGATTCSNFFTIYAYAQALDKQGALDSEVLTKSLVEVEITTPATATIPAVYKVKKLYTQQIPLGH